MTLELVPQVRHHSHGNIQPLAANPRIFGGGSSGAVHSEDLVLSVLKSPVNHVATDADNPSDDEGDGARHDGGGKFRSAGSEDELTDNEPSERVPFLQRLRGHRTPRFGNHYCRRYDDS